MCRYNGEQQDDTEYVLSSDCSIHFDSDKYIDSSLDLFRFTVDIHNVVNKQLNKPEWTMDDALIKYQQSCSKCEQTPHNLQELIDGIKPEKVSQNKPTESILSIAIDNLIC